MSILRFTKDQVSRGHWAADEFVTYADHLAAYEDVKKRAYLHGLDQAREAVAALANKTAHPWASIGDALAAIDALVKP